MRGYRRFQLDSRRRFAVSTDEGVPNCRLSSRAGRGRAGFADIALRCVCESALSCQCSFWREVSRLSRDLLENRVRFCPNVTYSGLGHCNAAERQSRDGQTKNKYMIEEDMTMRTK